MAINSEEPMNEKYVYHWTHRHNVASILARGLLPSYAHTCREEVWVCGVSRIAWALAHIAQRHGWSPDDMVCVRIRADRVNWTRTAFRGVWITRDVIPCSAMRGIKLSLIGPFVPSSEMRRHKGKV